MLTCSGSTRNDDDDSENVYVVTWNLQTDGVVSNIVQRGLYLADSTPGITYSMNGEMVGVLYPGHFAPGISIYNVVSGVYMYDINRGLYADKPWVNPFEFNNVWTDGEFLRFAIVHSSPISIWEARFTTRVASTRVETLSVPDHTTKRVWSRMEMAQTSPTSYRLALFCHAAVDGVLVWDTKDSKPLLRHTDVGYPFRATFSSDGRFFACSSEGSEVYLWKEDSTGYTFRRKLATGIRDPIPLLSPDGESIITFGGATVRLWHTSLLPPTPSSAAPQSSENFVLDFLPDRSAVAVARLNDNVVVILDLESGIPRLTIDTGIMVHGLRVTEDVVAVIGNGRIVTWNLLGRSTPPATRMKPEDSARTITFDDTPFEKVSFASTSPDSHRVAILSRKPGGDEAAYIFDLRTGSSWTFTYLGVGTLLWFPPGDEDLWVLVANGFLSGPLDGGERYQCRPYSAGCWRPGWDRPDYYTGDPPQGCPWSPSHGYKFLVDRWIYGPGGKRLLMLPPSWLSDRAPRVWNGQFLALLHGSLPEPLILDLEPQPVSSL